MLDAAVLSRLASASSLVIGVLADTHVPDRLPALRPQVLEVFMRAKVDVILHAGDICVPQVLDALGEVAPVIAVKGNRDWVFGASLPALCQGVLGGVPTALLHGHGNSLDYWRDKMAYLTRGYAFERYAALASAWAPDARLIVFGHSHTAENRQVGDRLYFNPGSACVSEQRDLPPSVGLLRVEPGMVTGEIIPVQIP
jgi:putative phosphoesterase